MILQSIGKRRQSYSRHKIAEFVAAWTMFVVVLRGPGCARAIWLSGLRAKQGMLPLLAHEVRPCLIYGDAVLEVGQGQAVSCL
jgi:hypothetical protein